MHRPFWTVGRRWGEHLHQPRNLFLATEEARDLQGQAAGVARFRTQGGKRAPVGPVRHPRVLDLEQSLGGRDVAQAVNSEVCQPDARLEVGDVMIAAGTPDELRRLEELFAPREAVA